MRIDTDLCIGLTVSLLIGAWMIIWPSQLLFLFKAKWYFRINPALEDMEDNPNLQSLVRLIGIIIVGVAIPAFLKFAFLR